MHAPLKKEIFFLFFKKKRHLPGISDISRSAFSYVENRIECKRKDQIEDSFHQDFGRIRPVDAGKSRRNDDIGDSPIGHPDDVHKDQEQKGQRKLFQNKTKKNKREREREFKGERVSSCQSILSARRIYAFDARDAVLTPLLAFIACFFLNPAVNPIKAASMESREAIKLTIVTKT